MKREGVSEMVTMDDMVTWLAAAGDGGSSKTGESSPEFAGKNMSVQDLGELNFRERQAAIANLPAHSFPAPSQAKSPLLPKQGGSGAPEALALKPSAEEETSPAQELMQQALETETLDQGDERERRIYRGRTVGMLRRYMRYSIETGRLPSLLGKEFFRTQVTSYGVGSFEDRVIFVHDMEICLAKLDEFSRQLIARHILEEHDQAATPSANGPCGRRPKSSTSAEKRLVRTKRDRQIKHEWSRTFRALRNKQPSVTDVRGSSRTLH